MYAEKIFLESGYLLFCFGTLLGIPHGRSKGRGNESITELWRVAHLSTCIGGIAVIVLTYALQIILPFLWVYPLSLFTIASYLFAAACTWSGACNSKWYGKRLTVTSKSIYLLHLFASLFSVLAVFISVFGLL
jgi:hypothetical protein